MKLSDEVMLEIVDIFRQGLAEGKDVSDLLRDLDLEFYFTKLSLSTAYKISKGRAV